MTRRGTFGTAIVLAMICGVSSILMAQTANGSAEKKPEPLSGLDKRFIDTGADPCVDFFKYACGNFTKYYPIPNDRSGYGTGAMVAERNEYILHTMLEKAAAGGADRTPNEQKIGDYYASCLDVDAINKKGLVPLQPDLDRIAALKNKSELTSLLAHFQLINANAFLGFGEQQDFKDATKQIALVDQGGLGLPERDYYFRTGEAAEKTRKEYVQHITNMLKLMGEPENVAGTDAQSIMQLETALAKVSMDITTQRDPNKVYHMMQVSELQKLTPPLFDPKATDAENYGHIGGVVGHELTHGFDDQGRQFDGNGNLSDWWTPEDGKKFEEKADCTVKEYGSFVVVDDVKVNGKLTLGENTADNGGLRLAFMAFLEDAKRKNIDLKEKQGGYTPIQQFFLGHGQTWCGDTRPEQLRLQVQTDPHSPRQFRVNGVVENMPEFGEAFGCKTGQPMMPQKVCRVW